MFSYFGSKSKIIQYYPPPKHHIIVEPFAGSARYALKYGLDRGVWLNDKYDVVCKIWKFLRDMTKSDLESLPHFNKGDRISDMEWLSDDEKLLLGFCVGMGRNSPGNQATARATADDEVRRFKQRMRPIIGRISHWRITNHDFRKVRLKQRATYYIDPPYQHRRSDYIISVGKNFYPQLKHYCKRLRGQVIICENCNADWWDFQPLVIQQSMFNRPEVEGIKVLEK